MASDELAGAANAVGPRDNLTVARRGRRRAVAEDAGQPGNVRCELRQGIVVDRRGRRLAREGARAAVPDVHLDAVGVERARLVVVRSLNDRGGRVRGADHIEAAHRPRSAKVGGLESTAADFASRARRRTRGQPGQGGHTVWAGHLERRIALSIRDSGDPVARPVAGPRRGWRGRTPLARCSRHGVHLASAPGDHEQGRHTRDSHRGPPHGSNVAPRAGDDRPGR